MLILLGCFGYFGAAGDHKSFTALIPAAFGLVLGICGVIAMNPAARKHAMHIAVSVGLIGALAGFGRFFSKLSALMANDPALNTRAVYMTLAMGVICLVFMLLCINSFIQARKRQRAAVATSDTSK
jgi:fluoride ion exporter CrcB/FEX